MTYKINPIIEKIQSPVTIILPDDTTREYASGAEASKDTFDKNYVISSITAEDGTVVITLSESQTAGSSWIGEEQTSFF